MRRVTLAFLALTTLIVTPTVFGQASVSLDHVDGLNAQNQLNTGQEIIFHIRLTNNTGQTIGGSTNGFRFYSPDGAAWSPLTADSISLTWGNIYDGGLYFSPYGVTGSNSDTIGIGGFAMQMMGLPQDFDQVAYLIKTSLSSAQVGKNVCLDSCYYPPIGTWLWAAYGGGEIEVGWDGPHCWEIGGCCEGLADDANGDGSGPDIADLVYLVNYMFNGGPLPPCMDEVDHNGDGTDIPDIADLVYLVNYMFNGGPALAGCQ